MIKISKTAKPQVLIENAPTWTKEYCDCLKAGKEPSKEIKYRYNHPKIKQALEKETHGKCAYCESKIKQVAYGDIEHILPKNKNARPELYVEWDNLTLACEQCNRAGKGTYYDPNLPLVNPYTDTPDDYLRDYGPLIMPLLGNDRGIATERVIKLNRMSLVERRTERIKSIETLLQSWAKEANPTLKKLLEEQLHDEYSSEREYSSTVKSFLRDNGFPVIATVDIS